MTTDVGRDEAIAQDERWALWVAKGAVSDSRTQRHAVWTLVLLVCGVTVWVAWALAGR